MPSSRTPADQAKLHSRRRFLKQSAVVGAAAAWYPAFRIGRAEAAASCPPPPNFPAGVELYQQAFENWSKGIHIDDLWTCSPRDPQQCLEVANWAMANGWKVRPRGAMHNWSPIHVTPDTTCADRVVLLNTTDYLTAIQVENVYASPAVRAQSGVFMEDLLTYLEARGLGMTSVPAPGDITVGGVLAIDAHGTGVPALGEQRMHGHSYGTLSNLLLELTVLAWDSSANAYVLQTYDRAHPHFKALSVNLGRVFVVEAVFRVGANYRLRCQSFTDITTDELLAPAGSAGRTVESYLDSSGRMEVIWFPFTDKPWFKVWTVSPRKPLLSREVTEPYNYPFSDNIPAELEELARSLTRDNKESTPLFAQTSYNVTATGLVATNSADIWGLSKNLLLYIKPSTLRATANGYVVLTRRDNVQHVIHEFFQKLTSLIDAYEAVGEYPMNMPLEIRVTGLDDPAELDGVAGAEAPILSAVSANNEHPEWNVGVWFNCLSFVGTEKAQEFYTELETWLHNHFDPREAMVRPEWSKGWGYTASSTWDNDNYLEYTIPNSFLQGRRGNENWNAAIKRLDSLDPYRVFSNSFIDRLLQPR